MSRSISPISKTNPACFGCLCNKHGSCARYTAIDQSGQEGYHVIAMCHERGDNFPLFVPVDTATSEHHTYRS